MSSAKILAYIESLEDELIAIRRDFHEHPELLYDVDRTAALGAGTFRAFDKETVETITRGLAKHAKSIADAYGGSYTLQLREGITVVNESLAVQHVLQAGKTILGESQTNLLDNPSLAGEDFGWYLDQVPGAFAFIGVGNAEQGIVHSIHHPLFNVDERVLVYGAKIHVQLAAEILSKN